MKYFFLLTICVFALSSYAFSQTLPSGYIPELKDNSIQRIPASLYQVGEVKGTVKNKPVFLPKIEYPREAIANDEEGEVRIQIAIDDEGNVTSANATAGQPVLKSYCEEVAKRTQFRIFRIDGQAVKTTGEMVYQFEIKKAGWTKIGANLDGLKIATTLRYFAVPTIARAFGTEWKDERELLGQIARMKMDELKKWPDEPVVDKPTTMQMTTVKTANGSFTSGVVIRGSLPIRNPPTPERIAISRQLVTSIRARLAKDEWALWQFDLGIALNSIFMLNRNPNGPNQAVGVITGFIRTAPKDVSPSTLSRLKLLAAKFEVEPRANNELPNLISAIINSN